MRMRSYLQAAKVVVPKDLTRLSERRIKKGASRHPVKFSDFCLVISVASVNLNRHRIRSPRDQLCFQHEAIQDSH